MQLIEIPDLSENRAVHHGTTVTQLAQALLYSGQVPAFSGHKIYPKEQSP
jgi:hypothetical protein